MSAPTYHGSPTRTDWMRLVAGLSLILAMTAGIGLFAVGSASAETTTTGNISVDDLSTADTVNVTVDGNMTNSSTVSISSAENTSLSIPDANLSGSGDVGTETVDLTTASGWGNYTDDLNATGLNQTQWIVDDSVVSISVDGSTVYESSVLGSGGGGGSMPILLIIVAAAAVLVMRD